MRKIYFLLSIFLLVCLLVGGFYFLKNFEKKKIEEKNCLETQNFNQDQFYKRAMESYFQSYKDDIIFKKSKDKVDDNEKSNNATYNLFLLRENIHNFNDLQHAFEKQIENPYNTLNSKISGKTIEDKILDEDLVLEGMSHGSVVVLTGFSKIRENINLNNNNLYHQSNNKNSFLLTISAGSEKSWQIFYPSDCCKIISYVDVLKVEQTRADNLSKAKKAKYYLLVSDYSYEINMSIRDMKFQPLKKIRFESQAHPINECGLVNFNDFFPMGKINLK